MQSFVGSAVTITKLKTAFFLSELWRTETEVFWSHMSGFNQGSLGRSFRDRSLYAIGVTRLDMQTLSTNQLARSVNFKMVNSKKQSD